MLNDDDRHIPVRLCMGGPARFATGGLAHAANAVSNAGRFGDDMVVHVNKREFEEMRQNWGDPHINPDTGLPEFWSLKDLWHDVKDYVAPVAGAALGAFAPAIGETVGNYLPGVSSLLGSTGTQALATGLLGAGAGYLLNGGQGALMGGLGGALGAYGGDLMHNGAGSTVGSAIANAGSAAGTLGASVDPITGGGGTSSGLGMGAIAPALLAAVLNGAGSVFGAGDKSTEAGRQAANASQTEFNKPLPTYTAKRKRVAYTGVPDYTTQGERQYFTDNALRDGGMPHHGAMAAGSSHQGYVPNTTGDDARSDKIKALLSPNEYVIDGEVVSLLGNGSPEAGAKRLDQMRANVRRHKGSALAQGAISPDALPPEQYI